MSHKPDDKHEFADLEPLEHTEEPQELDELEPLPEESDPTALPEQTESIAERSSLPAMVPLPGLEPQPPAARARSEGEEPAEQPEREPQQAPRAEEGVSEEIGAGIMPDLHEDQPHHPAQPRQDVSEVEPLIEEITPPIEEPVGSASAAPLPAGGPPATPEGLPVQPAIPMTSGSEEAGAAARREGPIKPVLGKRRDLEQTPQVLRKAAKILFVGALFPWLVALKAEEGVAIPWAWLYGAKAVALVAAWLFHQGVIAGYGGTLSGVAKALGGMHKRVPTILAAVTAIAAFVLVLGRPGLDYLGATGEIATLLLATATFSHIHGYEHGAKFNPIFPFMFLGPAVAGVLSVFGGMAMLSQSPGLAVAGLAGDLLVGAGGCMAIYSLALAMKQAKVEGELKKQQLIEHRKAVRAAQRGKQGEAGNGPQAGARPRR